MSEDAAIAGILIVIAIMLGGAVAYHFINEPQIPSYLLELSISPHSHDIGNLTITNGESYHYNITGSYFNVTLKGFVNYTVLFSFPVVYNNIVNATVHVYLQGNISVQFKTNNGSATPGPIYIS